MSAMPSDWQADVDANVAMPVPFDRAYLWVFRSSSVVYYVRNESRSADVIEVELAGVHSGIISCDRYSA